MSGKVTDFPQYRKLSNGKVFYRIRDARNFDEIQVIGTVARLHSIAATQYPEILKIQDMLDPETPGFEPSDEQEFEDLLDHYALR